MVKKKKHITKTNREERFNRNRSSGRGILYGIKRDKWLYLMFLPVLIWYILFTYVPMLGNIIAFYDYSNFRGLAGSDFVGFKHFEVLFNDPYFYRLFRNTLILNIYLIVIGFPLPVILALLLNEIKNKTFKKSSQTISYLPYFLSAVVAMGIVRMFVATEGPINTIGRLFGLDATNFLIHPQYFRALFIVSDIWTSTGFGSILYLAALSNISQDLYEAADIDGASKFQKIWYITLPELIPVMTVQLIIRLGSIISVGHEKIILLYNPAIYETADVFNTYVYRVGLGDGRYSYSQAVSLFQNIIGFLLVFVANKLTKKLNGTGLW